MAEETGQERSEEATGKRLQDARNKGDIARSRELNIAVGLAVALAGLYALGPSAVRAYREFAITRLRLAPEDIFAESALLNAFWTSLWEVLWIMVPFLCLMMLSVFIGPLMMSGWTLPLASLKFDLKKLGVLKGLKRMVGVQGLGELVKAIIKVVALGAVAYWMLRWYVDDFIGLADLPLEVAVARGFTLVFSVLVALIVVVIGVAMLDLPWQRWQFAKKMRMTRQEVKDEGKETGGNPEIKAKVRSLQQSISQRRMLLDVPDADVVIVNPTHFSVALRYHAGLGAPEVVAKGVDHMAMRIREIARGSQVQIFSAPVLARALYRHAEVGEEIPGELYVAVAQVLAYVFQVQQAMTSREPAPIRPDHIDVPVAMRDTTMRRR